MDVGKRDKESAGVMDGIARRADMRSSADGMTVVSYDVTTRSDCVTISMEIRRAE